MNFKILFACLLILLSSCFKNDKENENKIIEKQFIVLIDSLNKHNVKLKKYLNKNQKLDTLVLSNINWKNELAMFISSSSLIKNLNDFKELKYIKGDYEYTEYKGNEGNNINKILIKKSHNHFIYEINYNVNNSLAEINYNLSLDSKKGFIIESNQKVPLAYKNFIRTEGIFY